MEKDTIVFRDAIIFMPKEDWEKLAETIKDRELFEKHTVVESGKERTHRFMVTIAEIDNNCVTTSLGNSIPLNWINSIIFMRIGA